MTEACGLILCDREIWSNPDDIGFFGIKLRKQILEDELCARIDRRRQERVAERERIIEPGGTWTLSYKRMVMLMYFVEWTDDSRLMHTQAFSLDEDASVTLSPIMQSHLSAILLPIVRCPPRKSLVRPQV